MLENETPVIHSPEEHSEASIDDENMKNVQVENPVQTALLEDDIEVGSHETDTRKKRLCKGKKKYVQFILFSMSCVTYTHIYINIWKVNT